MTVHDDENQEQKPDVAIAVRAVEQLREEILAGKHRPSNEEVMGALREDIGNSGDGEEVE